MSWKWRIIAAFAVLLLVGGWLVAQSDTSSDLPSTLEAVQVTLNHLEEQIKSLQQIVKRLAKDAKKNKNVTASTSVPAAVTAPPSPPSNFQKAKTAYRQGQSLEAQQSYDAAVAAYTQAIEADPRNDAAYLHRGYVHQQLGEFERAAADFASSLALQPNSSRAYLGRAVAEVSLGHEDNAVADIREALVRDPRSIDALLLRARIHQQRHELQDATADYGTAIAAAPNSDKGYLERAAALRSQDQLAGALADCDTAGKINPNSVAPYLCRATTYLKMNATGPAVEQINLAMTTAQTLHQPFPLPPELAQLLGTAKQPATTTAAVTNAPPLTVPLPAVNVPATSAAAPPAPAVKANTQPAMIPSLPMAHSMPPAAAPVPSPRSTAVAPQSPRQTAQAALPVQTAAGTQDADYYDRMGRALSEDEKFTDAVKALNRAIVVDPTRATAFNARGFAYLRLRQLKHAIDDFTEAIRLNPQYSNAYHNRAVAWYQMGDRAASAADEHKANETAGASDSKRPPNPLAARN